MSGGPVGYPTTPSTEQAELPNLRALAIHRLHTGSWQVQP